MVTIREARPEDAAAVAAVHVRAWQVAYRGLIPDDHLDNLSVEDRASRYAFGSTHPASPQTILAVDDEVVRGFASIGRSRDDDAHGSGEVFALYVDPSCWRKGIGRLLMTEACARLRMLGFEEAVLWLLVGNEAAARFYRIDRWRPDGCRRQEDVWGVEVDVTRYRRSLS